jgi:uncharacterized protein YdeI (YjbR/CyaY-like superfamily)
MAKKDPRIDAFINKSPDFTKPILQHLRDLIHSVCPQAEETIKWRMPAYTHHGILCMTPAFKAHCAVVFWHGSIRDALNQGKNKDAWGHLGKIGKLSHLPKDSVLIRAVKESMKLNESGKKKPTPRKSPKKSLPIPTDVKEALKKNKKAQAAFESFSPSHQKEYVQWITEAKRDETRQKRLKEMLRMLTEGKTLNWKYE